MNVECVSGEYNSDSWGTGQTGGFCSITPSVDVDYVRYDHGVLPSPEDDTESESINMRQEVLNDVTFWLAMLHEKKLLEL